MSGLGLAGADDDMRHEHDLDEGVPAVRLAPRDRPRHVGGIRGDVDLTVGGMRQEREQRARGERREEQVLGLQAAASPNGKSSGGATPIAGRSPAVAVEARPPSQVSATSYVNVREAGMVGRMYPESAEGSCAGRRTGECDDGPPNRGRRDPPGGGDLQGARSRRRFAAPRHGADRGPDRRRDRPSASGSAAASRRVSPAPPPRR